jgi:hypothetical protein
MQPYRIAAQYTAAYNHNIYGNIHGHVHDVSDIDITNADAQYLGLSKHPSSGGVEAQLALTLRNEVSNSPTSPGQLFARWLLPNPAGQFGPRPQAVQHVASSLRTTAFHILQDTCNQTSCQYTQVGALHDGALQLQSALEDLATEYRDSSQPVPQVLESRLNDVMEVKARIGNAHNQAAHLANNMDTIIVPKQMNPLIESLRDIGELTRNALSAHHEVTLVSVAAQRNPKHTDPHVLAKVAALQDVPDTSLACRITPIMCHRWQRFDIMPCVKKRHAQLAASCTHQVGCKLVLCDSDGNFAVEQPSMECVDPESGIPTGRTWRSGRCPR